MSERTAYDPGLRDDDGRLVPIANQNDKNLVPFAVASGVLTMMASGLLFAWAISVTVDDANREAARAAPPPKLSGDAGATADDDVFGDRSPASAESDVVDEGASDATPIGDEPPPT